MNFGQKKQHIIPELNTASLPDLIFTILFFFMLVTHMRKANIKVKYQIPQGKELTKLIKKTTVSYIYIGKPTNNKGEIISNETQIQLNDKIVKLKEIEQLIYQERKSMNPIDRKRMIVSIRADKDTPMGIISDLKQILRNTNTLNINLAAKNCNK